MRIWTARPARSRVKTLSLKPFLMSDKLEPGVDKPRRWQYPIGVIVILIFALLLYWLG